jgi:hypothetical protein
LKKKIEFLKKTLKSTSTFRKYRKRLTSLLQEFSKCGGAGRLDRFREE